jgi:8-oxo-dGTP pyrophosphatase MutT (NUDIX family)
MTFTRKPGKPITGTTLSAGVVVVRQSPEGWRVLMLRVYNYWDCPKGLVEPDEDPLATARREVLEETGIADLDFAWGEQFIETPPYSKGKVARYYLASTVTERTLLGINPELGRAEHHEARWLSFDEAIALSVPRLQRVLAWAQGRISSDGP